MTETTVRDRLRQIRAPKGELPVFDTDAAPTDPVELFGQWLDDAVDAGVVQANAMTLSTATADGAPSARTLLLKDVTTEGFWFASLSSGPKGAELEQNPRAALTIYWREHGRQVRVVGGVRTGPREVSERDFVARHPTARARAIAGEQSEPLPNNDRVQGLLASARELLSGHPEFVPPTWNAYVVEPVSVEFWQAAEGHEEVRLRYRAVDGGWLKERLWP